MHAIFMTAQDYTVTIQLFEIFFCCRYFLNGINDNNNNALGELIDWLMKSRDPEQRQSTENIWKYQENYQPTSTTNQPTN